MHEQPVEQGTREAGVRSRVVSKNNLTKSEWQRGGVCKGQVRLKRKGGGACSGGGRGSGAHHYSLNCIIASVLPSVASFPYVLVPRTKDAGRNARKKCEERETEEMCW